MILISLVLVVICLASVFELSFDFFVLRKVSNRSRAALPTFLLYGLMAVYLVIIQPLSLSLVLLFFSLYYFFIILKRVSPNVVLNFSLFILLPTPILFLAHLQLLSEALSIASFCLLSVGFLARLAQGGNHD
ncbi:MAG: hypothetical protein M1352_03030 [Patescibacteria group bacterium]|nr:hypothetical protein [Patescibacteria group bacterium]